MPVFRALVAKELVNTYSLTQVEAAQRLGTTQAAVSQYLNSKRAIKGAEQFANILPKVQEMACNIAKRLADKEVSWAEVTSDFCRLCSSFADEVPDKTSDDYII